MDLQAAPSPLAVARAVGVSRQAIQEMLRDGRLGEPKTNGELLKAYCDRLRATAQKRGASPAQDEDALNPQQEKALLDRSRREGQEIKNAVARGEYAPIELLTSTLAQASVAVVDRFDQLENMVRKSCPDMPATHLEVVKRVIANARNAWVQGTVRLVSDVLDETAEQEEVADVEVD